MNASLSRIGFACLGSLALIGCTWRPYPLWAQVARIEEVVPPSSLSPLPMEVGGRSLRKATLSSSGFGPDEYLSQWPGGYFETAFAGKDVYFRVGTAHEILHIVVDRQVPIVLNNPDAGVYRLSGMGSGKHAVSVFVVTEAQPAPNHFGGFAIAKAEKNLPIEKRDRQIEFIGDSHTVGYGNTSSKTECTQEEVWATTDTSQVFGALTANHYHADYQVNAISGRGIVRNYGGSPGDALPEAYPYVLFDRAQAYRDPAWKPRVIVISLGTNDFSTPLHAGEKWKTRDELHADYETTYVRFIQGLRAQNPDAYILLWATDMADGEIESEVRKVTNLAKAQGDRRIEFIPIDHLAFSGCHGHPSLADDKTISDKLIRSIDAHPQVWLAR